MSGTLVCIRENAGREGANYLWLVKGRERAALIDTGYGLDKALFALVRRLAGVPVICLLTHGDPDHAGGAALFEPVYLSRRDDDQVYLTTDLAYRNKRIRQMTKNDAALSEYALQNSVQSETLNYLPLNDGGVFDLGGVSLEVCGLPGHTNGSVGFFNTAEGYALTGDTVTRSVWVWLERAPPLTAFCGSLARIQERYGGKIRRFYSGHSPHALPPELVDALAGGAQAVLAGNTAGDPAPDNILVRLLKMEDRVRVHRVQGGEIVYDSRKLT